MVWNMESSIIFTHIFQLRSQFQNHLWQKFFHLHRFNLLLEFTWCKFNIFTSWTKFSTSPDSIKTRVPLWKIKTHNFLAPAIFPIYFKNQLLVIFVDIIAIFPWIFFISSHVKDLEIQVLYQLVRTQRYRRVVWK